MVEAVGAKGCANVDRLRGLLERLEGHWREQRAPIAELVAPGLSESEIDAATAPLGLRLPVEARVWFQWHDGVVEIERWPEQWRAQQAPAVVMGAAWFRLMSLDEAVTDYRRWRGEAEEFVARGLRNDPDELWVRTWFPMSAMLDSAVVLLVDCAVPEGAPTSVRVIDAWDSDPSVRAASLTEAVALWVDLLDRGLWWYSPETASWHEEGDLIDPALRRSRLV